MNQSSQKLDFIKKHPVQPSLSDGTIIPFDSTKTFCRTMPNGDLVQQKWLSYNMKNNCLYCSTCMAFSVNRESPFVTGIRLRLVYITL